MTSGYKDLKPEERCRPPEPTWFDIRDAINEDFRKRQLEEADKPKSN